MLPGTCFRLSTLALLRSEQVQAAFGEAVASFTAALVALFALFRFAAVYDRPETAVQAVTLAAIATLSSPAAVDAFVDRARIRSPVLPVLQLAARIDALVASQVRAARAGGLCRGARLRHRRGGTGAGITSS